MKSVFHINRELEPGRYSLQGVFADIGGCDVLSDIFADAEERERVIQSVPVVIEELPYEMFVDNEDGSITICLEHLRYAPEEILYLDIIHELCHVKQHMQGRDLYDQEKSYVDRDTEIEAYRVTVEEARRIGLSPEAIANYLRVSWITPDEHRRLVKRVASTDAPAGSG